MSRPHSRAQSCALVSADRADDLSKGHHPVENRNDWQIGWMELSRSLVFHPATISLQRDSLKESLNLGIFGKGNSDEAWANYLIQLGERG